GLTLYEFADYFISQGCVTAVNFDGGGSTQMTVENDSGTLYAPITFGRRVTSSFLIVKRPTVSNETKAELAGLIKEAEAVTRRTTYLNEAIISAKAVYNSELSLPGEYTRAIMELKDGISEDGTTNLALGKDYTTTGSISSDYITDLTDGVLSDVSGITGKWNGWTSNGTVTIDLGKSYSIDKIRVHMLDRPDYGIVFPTVTVAFSDDGVNYKSSSAQFPLYSADSTFAYWSQADNLAVTARYVKLNIALNGGFGFVNEIEVLGNDYDSNIALGKDYDVEGEVGEQYNYTTPLTDGVALETTSITKNRWLGLHSDGSVTFDLGGVYKVTKARIHMLNIASYGIHPADVSISVSCDGKAFTEYEGTFTTQLEDGVYWSELDNIAAVGRYIKISFKRTGSWVFLNEVELYGEHNLAYEADYVVKTDGGHEELNEKYHENGERLTDGWKAAGDVNNDKNVNGVKVNNTGYTRWLDASYVDVIVDLGKVMPTGSYSLYTVTGFYGYSQIEGLKVYTSVDGVSYTEAYGQVYNQELIGYGEEYNGSTPEMYKHTVSLANYANARYVKFSITPCADYGFVAVDEVEVTGELIDGNYEQTNENLVSGLAHTSTTGSEKGAVTYIANITDGIAKCDSKNGSWFGLRSSSLDATNANTVNDSADFIYDLGNVYDISDARIHLRNYTASGICPPKSIKLWVSLDGVNYANYASFTISSENGICYWAALEKSDELIGRYVKITVDMNADKSNGGGGWVMLNEIEVYGEEYKIPEDTSLYKSVSYEIKDDKIIFTVVTAAGDYNRIKVADAAAVGTSLGVGTYTIDANGNYVWTVKTNAPKETTTYAFDLRTTANKYLKD
ncbi:MAG: phosphodiester glycosidase family protein, partial [Clostridia bacterium]|nr:phosphodiester glycosidase family protein [Clostridia bacterium]